MHNFFAYLSRMKYIYRWSLRRSVLQENVMEHSCETAIIAHALVTIQNRRYGANLNADRAASLAVFHEAGEVITGDMPTPIKYFNPRINQAYKEIERVAGDMMMSMLPEDIAGDYEPLILTSQSEPEWPYVKAADTICAYIKCIEEQKSGNGEYDKAIVNIKAKIALIQIEAVADFMREFIPGYKMSLDALN